MVLLNKQPKYIALKLGHNLQGEKLSFLNFLIYILSRDKFTIITLLAYFGEITDRNSKQKRDEHRKTVK